MDNDFDFRQIPFDWALCYIAECQRKDECMRYQVCRLMPEGTTRNACVLPTVLRKTECPHFHPIRKVEVAVGFQYLFNDVKARDVTAMRSELMAYLGGGGTYYRYRNGARPLMPEQQQWIANLFRRYGYTENLIFDGYEHIYRFDD